MVRIAALILMLSSWPLSAQLPYFEFQVEKQATLMPDSPRPLYPELLKAANVEGEVLAQFVVDTAGRVESNTFKVLKSSHELFTLSVKSALDVLRFYPAELSGRKVRQLVQMPFVFGLSTRPDSVSPPRVTISTARDEAGNFPPTAMEIFIPPIPVPKSVVGFHLVAEFDVDETGKVRSFTFNPTPDAPYNRKIEEVLRSYRFKPGVTPDGKPVRTKARVKYDF